jgi:DNA mismatch repair ATPase MutS
MAVGTSIGIHDSLLDGRSRFQAEVLRLREIVDLLEGNAPVLFLLDELLSGTNSADRVAGATAVLAHLLDRGAIGLVTTHDLALARACEGLGGRAVQAHFEDQVVDDRMVFDYRLRPGPLPRGNALGVMRLVGLPVRDG